MKSRFLDNKQANKNEEERLEHGIFIRLSDDIHIQLFTDLFYVIKNKHLQQLTINHLKRSKFKDTNSSFE